MIGKVSRIRSLATLVILDGLRKNTLIGLVLMALAGVAGGLLFFDFIPRDIGRASSDFFFSINWIAGFIFLLFHAVQTISWDNERGAVHVFLARPITRAEYALSYFVGLALLLLLLQIILCGVGWGVLHLVKNLVGIAYFEYLSFTFFILTALGLYCVQLMILSVVLLFSSIIRGSFPVLLIVICYYFICSGLPVVRDSLANQVIDGVGHPSLSIGLKWLTAIFPDFSWLDFKNLVATSDQIPTSSLLWQPFAHSIIYIVIVLWLACLIYEKRDLQ